MFRLLEGSIGARSLASAFEKNTIWPLQTLDLSSNQFGDDGARSLASAFEKNTTWRLQSLDLIGNRILNQSIAFILDRNVSFVSIFCNFEQDDLRTAIIRTQAPLKLWNSTPLNPEILNVRKYVQIRVLLCSLRTASIDPASQLPIEIVKLIGFKLAPFN